MTLEADRYFEGYAEYSKVLRTWLVAYGVGAPILLATTDRLADKIAGSGVAGAITLCFLLGVIAQVFMASWNKAVMWALYYGSLNPQFSGTRRYRFAYQSSENLRVDIAVDLVSIVLFSIATGIALQNVYG